MRLMDAARDGKFDLILVEALDRLSRDQEDLAGLWKRLNFLGVELRAVHEGKADQVQIGVRGLLGSLFLTDLAHKVRRGMDGVIRNGRNAGGRAYGYRPVPGKRGELAIVEDEANVVRRISGITWPERPLARLLIPSTKRASARRAANTGPLRPLRIARASQWSVWIHARGLRVERSSMCAPPLNALMRGCEQVLAHWKPQRPVRPKASVQRCTNMITCRGSPVTPSRIQSLVPPSSG
jgi:hypothetical protein